MVERVRKCEQTLGQSRAMPLDEASLRYRNTVRKRLVAARDIKAGERLAADAMMAKRADSGVSPAQKTAFVGTTAIADIPKDTGIDWPLVVSRPS